MYLQIILVIGIWILAGVTLHIWYRRFYKRQVDERKFYRDQISRWEKEGYNVYALKKRLEEIPAPIDWEKVLFKRLRRIYIFIKYRILKRLLWWLYNKVIKRSGRILILITVLLNLAITLSAVGLLITKDVSFTTGISIAVVGFGFIIWSLTRLSKRHKPLLTDMVIILVISVIFVMVSSSYLHVKSFNDVKNSIIGPFTTENSSTPLE